MPVPAGAVGSELFMASPGADWQVVQAVVTAGVAEWQRNSFSFGMMGAACGLPVPNPNPDPYPCVYPMGGASASATPAAAITRTGSSNPNGNAGSWAVNEPGRSASP